MHRNGLRCNGAFNETTRDALFKPQTDVLYGSQ